MSRVLVVMTSLGALLHAAPAWAQGDAPSLSVHEVVRRALQAHPEVQSARAEVVAAEEAAKAAGRFVQHNPEVGVEAGAVTGTGELDLEVGLAQSVEVGGQRDARRKAAEASVLRARAQLRQAEREATAQAWEAFAEACAAQTLLKLAEEESSLATRLLEAVRAREAAGDATRLEVNVQLLETGRVRSTVLAARRRLTDARRALSDVTGGAVAADAVVDGTLAALAEALPPVPEEIGAEALEEKLAARPDVALLRAARDEAEATLRVARREAVPTPSVGLLYKRSGDEQVVAGTFGMALPLFDRAQVARAEAGGAVSTTALAHEAKVRAARAETQAALARYQTALAEVRLYEGALNDAARETAQMAEDAYRSGKLGLLDALALQREALSTKAAFIEAQLEWVRARATVANALGL